MQSCCCWGQEEALREVGLLGDQNAASLRTCVSVESLEVVVQMCGCGEELSRRCNLHCSVVSLNNLFLCFVSSCAVDQLSHGAAAVTSLIPCLSCFNSADVSVSVRLSEQLHKC